MSFLGPFLIALTVALLVTPLVRFGARRLGFVARPSEQRWHRTPTVLLGGIAVFVAAAAATAPAWSAARPYLALAAGSVVMFAAGLADDLRSLRPATKLTLQVIAASLVLGGGVSLSWTGSLTADSLLTVLWLVGLTNGFNLIDNMDGACAGVGAVAAATVAALAFSAGGGTVTGVWASALCGALLGFLWYNFRPASIFLGDSGSLFIGFLLAGLTVLASQTGSLGTNVVVPVLVLAVPVFDTTLVTVARTLSGRPASQGGTDHTTHRLVAMGFSERRAVVVLYLVAAVSGVAAWSLQISKAQLGVWLMLLAIGLVLLAVYLLRVQVYGGQDYSLLHRARLASLAADLMLRHSLLEVLLDVVMAVVAYYAAFRFRFGWDPGHAAWFFARFLQTLPVVIACKIVGLRVAGVYGAIWKCFGITEVARVLRGVALGTVSTVLALLYLVRFEGISRGAVLIDAVLFAALIVGGRTGLRLLPALGGSRGNGGRRAVVYGAGASGALLLIELASNRRYDFRLLGFIDDDVRKHGRRLRGVPILGGVEHLERLVERGGVEAVVLTSGALDQETVARIARVCGARGVEVLRFLCVLEPVAAAGVARDEGASGAGARP